MHASKTTLRLMTTFFACALTSSAFAESIISPAYMRSGPNAKLPAIAVIPAGADVQVMNCYGGWRRDWCQVNYNGVTGFVSAGVLAASGKSDVIVAPVVTNELGNMYKGPGTNYKVIMAVPGGATVNKGTCVAGWQTNWCQVHYNGRVGYMMEGLLSRQGAFFPM